jgi:alpha-L-fucosidase
LDLNGDAIYATKPWIHQNDSLSESPHVWYTQSKDESTVYGIVLGWPMNDDSTVTLGDVKTSANTQIQLIGYDKPLTFMQGEVGVTVQFPPLQNFMRQCEDFCQWGYTLKMTNLSN